MSRLVAFGCSHTYGEGLYDPQSAWPHILAQHYKLECVNNGVPASSNKRILSNILNFDFQPNDIVIIYWSHIERWTVFEKNKCRNILPSQTDEVAKSYYKYVYSKFDSQIMFDMMIDYANLFLERKNIKVYNFSVKPENTLEYGVARRHILVTSGVSQLRKDHLSQIDGKHMNKEGQRILADEMISCIGDSL